MYKVDLHTHSTASPDGGIGASQYERILKAGVLACVAITDHNRIDLALELRKKLGAKVIVGEEIMTTAGEIVGLFLTEKIEPNQTPAATVKAIKKQNGVVYIPHPFETMRKGLSEAELEKIVDDIDIIEVFNGRALAQNRSQKAVLWAKLNQKLSFASSDAHGVRGLGRTYTTLQELPTEDNFSALLKTGALIVKRPGFVGVLYPKYHKIRKELRVKK